jgi:hypothetical protein
MADDFDEYEAAKPLESLRIMAYGKGGMGKTTMLLDSCPRPLVFSFDDGLSQFAPSRYYAVPRERLQTWEGVLHEIRKLAQRPKLPDATKTVGFDQIGNIQDLIIRYVCKRDHNPASKPARMTWVDGKPDISGYGFGGMDGWKAALVEWSEFKSACEALQRKHDVNIVLLAHAANHKVKYAGGNDYSVIDPDVESSAAALLKHWVDVCVYIDTPRIVVATDDRSHRDKVVASDVRVGYTGAAGGAHEAKNRRTLDPEIAPFSWHALAAQIAANSPAMAAPVQAKIRELADRRKDPEVLAALTRAGTSSVKLQALHAELQTYVVEKAEPVRAEIEALLAGVSADKARAPREWARGIDEVSYLQGGLERLRKQMVAS